MIEIDKIKALAQQKLHGSEMFLVEVKVLPGSVIEIIVDSDSAVSIDACVALSKAVEESLDRESEDFELTVMSAGVGQPLKLLRQYIKLIGKEVEVVMADGVKLVATLKEATEQSITIQYEEKVMVEGKKRKELVTNVKEIALDNIKTTKEYINFK